MKLLMLVLFTLLIAGCSSRHFHPPASVKETKSASTNTKTARSSREMESVWELLSHSQISLQLKNIDNEILVTIDLEKGLTHKVLPKGHWELTGFLAGGKTFVSMKTSKKFVFRVLPKTHTYAGSIVIGCPSIASSDYKLLKGMSFFNRYPFSSSNSLCEMAIGSNFRKVRSSFRKSKKSNNLNLVMGF